MRNALCSRTNVICWEMFIELVSYYLLMSPHLPLLPLYPRSLPSFFLVARPIMQSLKEVKERVEGGYRMEAPEDCPPAVYLPNDRLLGAGAAQETCFPQAEGETGADDGEPQPGPRVRASGRGPVWLWMLILVLQWWRDTWDANPLIVHHTNRSSEMFLCTQQSNWIQWVWAKMVESYPDFILILRLKDCWMDCHETDNPGPQRINPNHLKDLNHWMDCHVKTCTHDLF